MTDELVRDRRRGVFVARLNRPDARNALTPGAAPGNRLGDSTIGREGGKEGLLPFLETKAVIIDGTPEGFA